MTIDERLDRLTERHEALAMSLELESVNIARQRENIDKLGIKVEAMVESVQDLIRVARMHDARIFRLEQHS